MQKAGEDACFAIFARHNRCLRVLESLIHDLLLPQDQATQILGLSDRTCWATGY